MKKRIIPAFFFLLIILAFTPVYAYAAKPFTKIEKTYISVGKRKVKVNNLYNGKLLYKTSGGTSTIKSNVSSAFSDGSYVYFTITNSKKLFRWASSSAKTTTLATLPAYSEAGLSPYVRLVGGYGKDLYFCSNTGPEEAACATYRYALSGKKSYKLKRQTWVTGSYGKYLLVEGSAGDPSPTAKYLFDMRTRKFTTIVSKGLSATISGNYVYYVQCSRLSKGKYSFKVMRYQISTKKKTTLSKSYIGYYCYGMTAHSLKYIDQNGKTRTLSY